MRTLKVLLALSVFATAYSAKADLRLSDIDTNDPGCAYARQEVSHLAANDGRLPIRFVCVNGPVVDPRGVEYAYQLQVSIPDETPVGMEIPLGVINTNNFECQKAQNELRLLNSSRVQLSFECVRGPIQDEHSGVLYEFQLRTSLRVLY